MGKTKYIGWSYAKAIIREFGAADSRLRPKEQEAVSKAIRDTQRLVDGQERLKLINLVFWKQTRTLDGACLACFVSERTGRQWHTDFIRQVCENLDLA